VEADRRREEYSKLVEAIVNCKKCPLHKTRRKPVPGEGPLDATVMIVGEAPGRKEDETGRPFVGAAGRLLDALLLKAGLTRNSVYITNIVKCRPPGNRDPTREEVEACLPYLRMQIRIIKPRVIIALGRHAARTLYSLAGRRWRGMRAEHGVPVNVEIEGLPVVLIPTYHPAAALYNPQLRGELERDFAEVISRIVKEVSGEDKGGERRRGRSLLDYL
jgi:uracil-DNA glycosylase family 4